MKTKKVPLRKCLGCNEPLPKRSLIRIVKNKDDEISIDLTCKKEGRGAYICKNIECFLKLKKFKKLEKAFKCQIDQTIYLTLEQELNNIGE